MRKNSSELVYCAVRKIQCAIVEKESKVTIVLDDKFLGGYPEVKKYCDELNMKCITKKLRKRFTGYEIKSVVDHEPKLTSIITFEKGPCLRNYAGPLIWTITLHKKD